MWGYGYRNSGLTGVFLDYLDRKDRESIQEYWRKIKERTDRASAEEHYLLAGETLVKIKIEARIEEMPRHIFRLACEVLEIDDRALDKEEREKGRSEDWSSEPLPPESGKRLLRQSLIYFGIYTGDDGVRVVSEEYAKRKRRLCKLESLVGS